MARSRGTRRAKRTLEQAAPHVGRDVLVIAPGVEGTGYLATSMRIATAADLEPLIKLAQEATKKLKAWQRTRLRHEAREREKAVIGVEE